MNRMIFAVRRNLSNCFLARKKKRFQGYNGIGTHDLRTTGALLYQLSYETLRCCQDLITILTLGRTNKLMPSEGG